MARGCSGLGNLGSWSRGVLGLAVLAGAPALAQAPVEVAERDAINPGLGDRPAVVARSSPAAAWRSFLALGAASEFAAAAHLLDLTEVPEDQQRQVGEEISRKLHEVLKRLGARPEDVTSEDPSGPAQGGVPTNYVVAESFQRPGLAGEVWLRRTGDRQSGESAWLFTRQTVSNVRMWHRVLVEGKRLETGGAVNEGLGPAPPEVRRSTPRAALVGFQQAARHGDFAVAAHYLNLDAFPAAEQPDAGARLARRLMLVMQRAVWINPQKVSNDPAGVPQAGVGADRQVLATMAVKRQDVELALERRLDSEGGFLWTFSGATVGQIDVLYEGLGYGWIGDHLPTVFFSVVLLGLQLWQWTALVLVVGLGYLVARLVGHLVIVGAQGFTRRTAAAWDDRIVAALDGPLGFVLWGMVVALSSPLVGLAPAAQALTHRGAKLLILVGLGWLLFRALDGVSRHLREVAAPRNPVALGFIPIVQRIGKILVVFLVALAALDVVGVNVVAALAGLGLGGLAVAFAAQKTLENVFGALAIAGDRPFQVGDFVQVGDVVGNVEDVGLRSTKIRTLERTVVTIPNAAVVNSNIVNMARRDRIFYRFTIGLVYGTTVAQLQFVVDEIRKLLLDDPRVCLDGQRARFRGFGPSSLDVEVFSWIDTEDYNTFTVIAEELNFRIMEIVERSGSSFAFPSQTLYLGRDAGLDTERARAVAKEVQDRLERGEMVAPEPTEARLERARSRREQAGRPGGDELG